MALTIDSGPVDKYDGRPRVDDETFVDLLLGRLIKVHGEPRFDLAPELLASAERQARL